MAKVSFTKLGLKKNEDVEILEWNDQKIEVKQYLPIEDKLELINRIIFETIDEFGFINSGKLYTYMILEIILAYTNINLTDKQKEEVGKTYDLIVSSGLSSKIFEVINPYEYQQLKTWIIDTADSIYKYRNSVLGILQTIKEDYADADFKAEDITNKLKNSEDIQLLKDIMDKLG